MLGCWEKFHVIGILPELPRYRLPGRCSVRPALRTQGEKGNAAVPSKMLYENGQFFTQVTTYCYIETWEGHSKARFTF